jgi:hypothetical protein
MQRNLARMLVGPREEVPPNTAKMREMLSNETRPRLFWSELRTALFSPENRAKTAAVLKLWVSFWGNCRKPGSDRRYTF